MVNVGCYILDFLKKIIMLITAAIMESTTKSTLKLIGNNLDPKSVMLVKYCGKIVNGEIDEDNKISHYEEIIDTTCKVKGITREQAAEIIYRNLREYVEE